MEGKTYLAALPAMRLRDHGEAVVMTAECPKDALAGLHQRLTGTPGVVSVSLVVAYNLDPEGKA